MTFNINKTITVKIEAGDATQAKLDKILELLNGNQELEQLTAELKASAENLSQTIGIVS